MPRASAQDLYLWGVGRLNAAHRLLGAHRNASGTWFRVWAPRADAVSLVGDFNGWDGSAHPMAPAGEDMGRIWEIYVRTARPGHRYKFRIFRNGHAVDKADPFGFEMEPPVPGGSTTQGLSSVVAYMGYEWGDAEWIRARRGPAGTGDAISIYEVHPGSWRRAPDGSFLDWRDLAEELAEYVLDMGFTHVELMPVMEHPFYGSWGYQVVGYFAPTFRFGAPTDFKAFVDTMHRRGIGVILDWVPAHFATDPQGLSMFDGAPLFEYEDPLMRHHPDWGTFVFDWNRPQVRNFLVSNALYWLEEFHVDGLRFDAVASMLYRDYSRKKWTPNMFGGRENLEAVDLLKAVNETVYSHFPEVLMIAEESTAWPGVSQPTFDGGLGFLYKWNMGWMHDTLQFMLEDPVHRRHHLNLFTFPLVYAWSERYIAALSHDEVVHGKGSIFGKMPGDDWQKAANVRLLYGHQFGHPGKKLTFMGGEFGQRGEWDHDATLEWELVGAGSEASADAAASDGLAERSDLAASGRPAEPHDPATSDALAKSEDLMASTAPTPSERLHRGIQEWTRFLNGLYAGSAALQNEAQEGFEWIDHSDGGNTVVSYVRRAQREMMLFVFNFTPVPRPGYRVGCPDMRSGAWEVVANSDAPEFGGSGAGSTGRFTAEPPGEHGRPTALELDLPPLGVLILRPVIE